MSWEGLISGGQSDVSQQRTPAQRLRLGEEDGVMVVPLETEVLPGPHPGLSIAGLDWSGLKVGGWWWLWCQVGGWLVARRARSQTAAV